MTAQRLTAALGGVAGAALIVMAACGPADNGRDAEATASARAAETPEAERYGGTAVWGATIDLITLNPLISLETNDIEVDQFMLFMPLVRHHEDYDPRPWLAASWDTLRVAPDTLQLTFHLRRDVKWHDGTPTTADDVKFTFDRMRDPRTAFPNMEEIAHYRPQAVVLDSFTVRFWLRAKDDPLSPWPWRAIAPKHILGDVPPEQLRHHPFSTTAPVGNGPYRFLRRRDRDWVFEANPDFPEALGGRPYLDRLVYRVIPDEQALVTAFLAGEVDFGRIVSADAIEPLRTRGLRILSFVEPEWVHIAWNTRLPMFRDARVRRALSMAIDRKQIVDGILLGYGEVGRGPVTPRHWSYDPADPEISIPYDPDGGRRLLAEAGWRDRNGDGWLEDETGRELRFTLMASHGSSRQNDIAAVVQAQLRRIGVAVEPLILEQGTKNSRLMGSLNASGERQRFFEAALWSWYEDPARDDSGMFHSRSKDSAFGMVGFENARADQLMDSLRYLMDREAARPLWKEYQRLMVRESPVTVLYYPQAIVVVSRRLRDVKVDARGVLGNVHRWWLLRGEE